MRITFFRASGLLALLVVFATARPMPTAGPIDFPLALNTRWTYHIHQEVGEGVHFGEEDAKLAKGNTLDATVVSTIAGHDVIGGTKYARVESLRGGRPFLTEWYASGPAGLLLARIVEAGGADNVMSPPQKLLILDAKPRCGVELEGYESTNFHDRQDRRDRPATSARWNLSGNRDLARQQNPPSRG